MREENKTNCDPFHCEVQGRGFCNSNLKRGATERHSQRTGFVTDSQPQPPPGQFHRQLGALFRVSSRNSFRPPSWEKLPVWIS